MDDATKRDLGGLLLGAVALALGLLIRASSSPDLSQIGEIAVLGGGLMLLVSGVRLGFHLLGSGR